MNNELVELGKKFFELKTKHEEQSAALKELGAEWEAVETELLETMAEEGVSSINIDGLGLFSMSTRNMLSVNAANKEKFWEYLKESGNGHLLKLDVNPRTLTAFLGEHLAALIEKRKAEGKMEFEAREEMLKFLNEKGASYFVKRGISFRKGK